MLGLGKNYTMIKFGIILLLITNIIYPYGIKRSVNIAIHKAVAVGIFGADDLETTTFGIGMRLPISRIVGINVGLCGLSVGGYDIYKPLIAGEAGIIEMLSTKYISLYSSQVFQPGLFRKERESNFNCFLAINVGIEFLSVLPISPFIEGGYIFSYLAGMEQFAIRGGGGLRYSF
jgi:hypothetical protein